MPYKDPEVARAKGREYYYRVSQARNGHIPGNQGGRRGKKFPTGAHRNLVGNGLNGRPAWLSSADERQDRRNIKEFICQSCGNNHLYLERHNGRCRACLKRKRLRYKAIRKADGRWGIICRLHKQKRRAQKRANGGAGTVTQADWQWVLTKYGTACLCCGHHCDGKPTMDHVVPLALGGPHDKSNLQPLCHLCNSIKNDSIADHRPDRPLAPMARDPVKVRYVPGSE